MDQLAKYLWPKVSSDAEIEDRLQAIVRTLRDSHPLVSVDFVRGVVAASRLQVDAYAPNEEFLAHARHIIEHQHIAPGVRANLLESSSGNPILVTGPDAARPPLPIVTHPDPLMPERLLPPTCGRPESELSDPGS